MIKRYGVKPVVTDVLTNSLDEFSSAKLRAPIACDYPENEAEQQQFEPYPAYHTYESYNPVGSPRKRCS